MKNLQRIICILSFTTVLMSCSERYKVQKIEEFYITIKDGSSRDSFYESIEAVANKNNLEVLDSTNDVYNILKATGKLEYNFENFPKHIFVVHRNYVDNRQAKISSIAYEAPQSTRYFMSFITYNELESSKTFRNNMLHHFRSHNDRYDVEVKND